MNTFNAIQSEFGEAMLQAFRLSPHRLSAKFLYDEAGSALFNQICDLPEYHVTRTELQILERHGKEIAALIGPHADILEFGAGSSRKIRVLLNALSSPSRYGPVDISTEHLMRETWQLRRDYPTLTVTPVEADILQPFECPPLAFVQANQKVGQRVGLFFGSSLGNFDDQEIRFFLTLARELLEGGALLLGIDLIKDPAMVHAAYNDTSGITAAFNLNILARANRELGANFELSEFFHHACYCPTEHCVEMHLISKSPQDVRICGETFALAEGESVHTETSRKFTLSTIQSDAVRCGWHVGPVWVDPNGWYALQWLHASEGSSRHLM